MHFPSVLFASLILAAMPLAAQGPANAAIPLHKAFGDHFLIGAAVLPPGQLHLDERKLLTEQFNTITP